MWGELFWLAEQAQCFLEHQILETNDKLQGEMSERAGPEHSFSYGYISRRSFGAAEPFNSQIIRSPQQERGECDEGVGSSTSTATSNGGAFFRAASNRSKSVYQSSALRRLGQTAQANLSLSPNRFLFLGLLLRNRERSLTSSITAAAGELQSSTAAINSEDYKDH